jgi:uncharacterized protein (DUF1330 family)
MSAYITANLNITDRERYADYEAGFAAIFAKHGGEMLAVDDQPGALEGDAIYNRCVIIRFPDSASAMRWWNSDEYQALASIRHEASSGTISLVTALKP